MKVFDTQVEFPRADAPALLKLGYVQVFEMIFNQGFQGLYPQGMPSAKGRIWSRVLTKIDAAIQVGATVLELEEAEIDIIKDVFLNERLSYQPTQYRVVSQYADKLNALSSS